MQKGGILIKDEFKDRYIGQNISLKAFEVYLYNARCSILTYKSRGGILFKLELKENVESPYKLSRSNAPEKDVTEILLKFVFINEDYKSFEIIDGEGRPLTDLNPTNLNEFETEVRIQTDIFTRSLDANLEPICPNIVFCNKLDSEELKEFIDILLPNSRLKCAKFLRFIKENSTLSDFKIGIISMECLSGFITLDDYQKQNPSQEYISDKMAMFEIARLYKLGYIHGDLNKGNVLIDPTYKYFHGIDGRVSLIDFGSTFKPNELFSITNHILYNASSESLKKDSPIYNEGTSFNHEAYQWLKIKPPKNEEIINDELFELSELREIMEQKFIEHVEGDIIIVNINDEMSGGENQILNLPISSQELTFNPELIKSNITQKPLQQSKFNVKINSEMKLNIFDKLDPDHIFTTKFIKEYIKKENEYAEKILKSIITLKGGKNKTKKIKQKKIKQKKIKEKIKQKKEKIN